jgi:DNA-binding response OmpR family regulator
LPYADAPQLSIGSLDPEELARLRDRFRATRGNTIEAFRKLAERLGEDPSAPEVVEGLRRELHRIRGTAGSFGYIQASELAGGFEERALRWHADPQLEVGQRRHLLDRFIVALDELLGGDAAEAATGDGLAGEPLMLVIGATALEEPLRAEAALRAIRLRSISLAACSPDEVRAIAPHLIMSVAPVERQVVEVARALNLPIVALESRPRSDRGSDHGNDRATVTVDVSEGVGPAFEVGVRLLVRSNWSGATILAVDDDPVVLLLLKTLFAPPEFDLQTLQDGSRLFEMLAATDPALLVMDVEMGAVNGIELVRQLRQRDAFRDLTVVLLSGATDSLTRDAAFAAGADEFVSKPIVFSELRARVTDRLDRRRASRLSVGIHPATGLALPERAYREATDAVAAASRASRPMSVVVVRPRSTEHEYVSSAEWLRETARIARALQSQTTSSGYGEEHDLVLLLPEAAALAAARLRSLAGATAGSGSTWTAGVVDLATARDRDFGGMRRAAAEAATSARADGKERVHLWVPADSQRAPEVILVEDDGALSEMMQYALRATGITFEAFDDGLLALDALLAYDIEKRHPIVLLDVDLPGIDGHTLHERLRARRPGAYRVVYVTVHSGEAEQLRALHAGAVDYVPKPINIRILMAKMASWIAASRGST